MVPSWSVVCNAPLTAAAGTLAKAANVINVKTRPNHSLGLGEEDFERVIVALFLLFANQRQVSGYAAERPWGKRLQARVLRCDVAHTALRGPTWTAGPTFSPSALLKLRLQTLAVNSQKVATCTTTLCVHTGALVKDEESAKLPHESRRCSCYPSCHLCVEVPFTTVSRQQRNDLASPAARSGALFCGGNFGAIYAGASNCDERVMRRRSPLAAAQNPVASRVASPAC